MTDVKHTLQNDEKQKALRRDKDTLRISGAAVILFGIWSILKTVIIILMDPTTYFANMSASDISDTISMSSIVTIIVLFVIELSMRLYVGRSAVAESRGIRKRRTYLVFTFLMMIGSVFTIALSAIALIMLEFSLSNVATLIVEITSFSVLLHLFVVARRLRKLTKFDSETSKTKGKA